jgi:predicted lipid-binding transport protein (Tim44 family)
MSPLVALVLIVLVFFVGPIVALMVAANVVTRLTGFDRRPEMLSMFMPRLAHTDPVWRDKQVLKRAKEVFLAVQQAWGDRDHAGADAFMTPELIETHRAQLADLEGRQERSVIASPKVHQLLIVHAADYEDDTRDEVWVQIASSAIDYTTSVSGDVLRGDKDTRTHYTEIWKLRRHEDTWRVHDVSPFEGFPAVPDSFSEILGAGVDRR